MSKLSRQQSTAAQHYRLVDADPRGHKGHDPPENRPGLLDLAAAVKD